MEGLMDLVIELSKEPGRKPWFKLILISAAVMLILIWGKVSMLSRRRNGV